MLKTTLILALAIFLAFPSPGGVRGSGAQQLTITMGDFSFTPGKITLQAGVPAEIALVNKGTVIHEWAVYLMPKPGLGGTKLHEWAEDNSYFKGLELSVASGPGIEVERKGPSIFNIEVAAGKSTVVKFTPVKMGTFEMGCEVPGHYEIGMKGTLTVR